MIDILKRIFVGVAIGMSIFFIKSNFAHALTYDLNFQGEFYPFGNGDFKLVRMDFNSGATTSSSYNIYTANFDNNYTNTDGYNFAVFPIMSVTYNQAGESQTPSLYHTMLDYNFKIVLTTNGGAWSTCELQNNFIVCPINKGTTYTSIQFFVAKSFVNVYSYISLTLNNSAQLYNGSIQAIASSSQETLNETKKITDTNDQSGSGNSYDNSGVTSNNSKEESLTDNADDLFDNFDVDLSSNSNAFQFIFQLMTRFVQANSKIFGVFLSILSFGFIKLVLGR